MRPASYHALTDTSYHVLAIDYRGFGHSTGSPTEDGLLLDAAALVDFAVDVAGIPPSRIVLMGHSLGTAVVAGVAERYSAARGVDFAGVVLIGAFSSLPTMLSGYAIAGLVPVLRPLALAPRLLDWIMGFLVDRWDSAARLAAVVRAVVARGGRLHLSLLHAADDWDIPCAEDDKLFAAAVRGAEAYADLDDLSLAQMKEERTSRWGEGAFVSSWRLGPDVVVTQERFPYGGELMFPVAPG